MVRSFWLSRCISTRKAPLGPRTRTVSWPAPAPRVSHRNRDWNVASTPGSTPGPYTRTYVVPICIISGIIVTDMLNKIGALYMYNTALLPNSFFNLRSIRFIIFRYE